MKKIFLIIFLAALTIGLLSSCNKEDNKVPVTDVTLDQFNLTISVDEADVQLTATVYPDNATDKTVSWSSDKTEFATVDNQGNVHAVAPGTANIIVTTTDGGKTDTCAVVVKKADILKGEFSVSDGKKVHFSKGNLVATVDASGYPVEWNFAENQYDYGGGANSTIGKKPGDVDMFGWSASDNGGASSTDNFGIKTSITRRDYRGAFYDWGNAVGDGITWYTLSQEEWKYLINNGNIRKGKYKYGVKVCGKRNCLVLAPDGWDPVANPLQNEYSLTSSPMTWEQAEAAGLVCLPAAGYRKGSRGGDIGATGEYWTSSAAGAEEAHTIYFTDHNINHLSNWRFWGVCVRLVTDVE